MLKIALTVITFVSAGEIPQGKNFTPWQRMREKSPGHI
jgi:hypothetical protein